jgi:5'-nucleotidase
VLFCSAAFSYSYDLKLSAGSRVRDMRLAGMAISPASLYRVAMNSFLASGGDGFSAFTEGGDALGGELDVDALESYLKSKPGLPAPATDRITRL